MVLKPIHLLFFISVVEPGTYHKAFKFCKEDRNCLLGYLILNLKDLVDNLPVSSEPKAQSSTDWLRAIKSKGVNYDYNTTTWIGNSSNSTPTKSRVNGETSHSGIPSSAETATSPTQRFSSIKLQNVGYFSNTIHTESTTKHVMPEVPVTAIETTKLQTIETAIQTEDNANTPIMLHVVNTKTSSTTAEGTTSQYIMSIWPTTARSTEMKRCTISI